MSVPNIYTLYATIAVLFYCFLREDEEGRWLSALLAATFPVSIPVICFHALWKIYHLFSSNIPEARVVSKRESSEMSKLQ